MENIVSLVTLLYDIPIELNFECGVRNHFCAVLDCRNLCHDCVKLKLCLSYFELVSSSNSAYWTTQTFQTSSKSTDSIILTKETEILKLSNLPEPYLTFFSSFIPCFPFHNFH